MSSGGGGKGGGESQVTGYRYYIGMHMVLCRAADALIGISVGQRILWNRNPAGDGFNTKGLGTSQDFYIDQSALFGGDSREGGIAGTIGLRFGEPTQVADSYLKTFFGKFTPAFRGVVSVILKEVYIGLNPYLKDWAFLLTKTKHTWKPDLAAIPSGDGYIDCNPAHIVYDCITEHDPGMGYPTTRIDEESFGYAAQTLYTEGFGLSLIWDQQGAVEDFIQKVLNHINGVVYQSRSTGKFVLKLLRADYNVNDLPIFNEDNILAVTSYQIPLWGETINEVVVKYTDRLTTKDLAVTVQDLANHQIQTSMVSKTSPYPGIASGDLATRVAQRDLQTLSTPLAKIKFTANRAASVLNTGDVFVLSWPKLNIVDMVFRVGDVDYGELTTGDISVTAVEDVFGMPATSFGGKSDTIVDGPQLLPINAPLQRLIEVNFWELVLRLGATAALQQQSDSSWVFSSVARPAPASYSFQFSTSGASGTGPFNAVSRGHYSPVCKLPALVAEDFTTLTYTDNTDMKLLSVGDYGYVGDEAVSIAAIDMETSSMSIHRGVLDTVPVAHAAGTYLYVTSALNASNTYEYIAGETIYGQVLPTFPLGTLDPSLATPISLALPATYSRHIRPYPPGNVKVNGVRFPATVSKSADMSLSWARRNRAQQTVDLPLQTDGDITPETGTTYTVKVSWSGGTLSTITGITTTSASIAALSFASVTSGSNVTIEVWAVRSGIPSYQNAITICQMI